MSDKLKPYRVIYDGPRVDLEAELNQLATLGYRLYSAVGGFAGEGESRNPVYVMALTGAGSELGGRSSP